MMLFDLKSLILKRMGIFSRGVTIPLVFNDQKRINLEKSINFQ